QQRMNMWLKGIWLVLALVWLVEALRVKRTERTESPGARIAHFAPVTLGFVLLFTPATAVGPLGWRWLPADPIGAGPGVALTAAGAAFAIWARLVIGRNWSGTVTIKAGHELVRTGPYACVRHPIYTGLLLAAVGTSVYIGELRGLVAVALMTAA